MKTVEYVNEYAYSNTEGIKATVANARAAIMMMANLYQNPPLAFIREMACNAYDAHVMADNLDQAFDLHFPTQENPNLTIRDYGTGLSKEFMETRYTAAFDSTKIDTNKVIGGFGVGRLSFLSVTEMAIVTSYFNGMKYTYNVSRDGNLDLTFFPLGEEETDEPNGLELTFTPTQEVIHRTIDAAQEFFKRFLMKPNLTGAHIDLPSMDYNFENELWGVRNEYGRQSQLNVVMGGVAYPVNKTLDSNPLFQGVESMLDSDLDLFFDIGQIELAPSREGVMQTDATLKAIADRLNKIKSFYLDSWRNGLSEFDFIYQKKEFYQSFYATLPTGVNSIIKGMASNYNGEDLTSLTNKFCPPVAKNKVYRDEAVLDNTGTPVLNKDGEPLLKTVEKIVDGPALYLFHEKSSYKSRDWNTNYRWDKNKKTQIIFECSHIRSIVFVLMDCDDRSWKSTIEYNLGDCSLIRCIHKQDRAKDFKSIIKQLIRIGFKSDQFVSLSSMDKKPREKKQLNGRRFRHMKASRNSHEFSSYSSKTFENVEETAIYVVTNRHAIVDTESLEAMKKARFAIACGLMNDGRVYGVSKSYLSSIPENWIDIRDYMDEIDVDFMERLVRNQYRSNAIAKEIKRAASKFARSQNTEVPYKDRHGHVKFAPTKTYESSNMKYLRMGKSLSPAMLRDIEFLYERHKKISSCFDKTNVDLTEVYEHMDLTNEKNSAMNLLQQNYAYSKLSGFIGSDIHKFLSSKDDPIAFMQRVNDFMSKG